MFIYVYFAIGFRGIFILLSLDFNLFELGMSEKNIENTNYRLFTVASKDLVCSNMISIVPRRGIERSPT